MSIAPRYHSVWRSHWLVGSLALKHQEKKKHNIKILIRIVERRVQGVGRLDVKEEPAAGGQSPGVNPASFVFTASSL